MISCVVRVRTLMLLSSELLPRIGLAGSGDLGPASIVCLEETEPVEDG